ncbi:hypothetical protein MMC21_004696 [Puttea exsequens]|nr:hypothetical protein [Puttea exsequens]
MASATIAPIAAQSTPGSAAESHSQPRGQNNLDNKRGNQGGIRGDRSRGGQRGSRGNSGARTKFGPNQREQRLSSVADQSAPPIPPPPGLGGGGTFGGRLTKDAENSEGEVEGQTQSGEQETGAEEGIEAEVCFICASPVIHNSVAPCNHRTCHICALRLRALYKTKQCAHCRTEAEFVIFTDDPSKRFEDFSDKSFQETDRNFGIKYEQKEIYEDTRLLLQYNCPDASCDKTCWGWPDLHKHVRNVHHKMLCDLCIRNKKVFTHEHELFTKEELRRHEKFGDDNPGAVDQSGFKGHPECGFCRQRFYGDDELYVHCRERHEKCHICDMRNPARQQQYYVDYGSLEQHFRVDHFLCPDQECLDKKFVVFESEMDLKAHQLEAHPNGLSKDARRDARRVDISGFDYRTPHQDHRGGRREREGRGRGRGRDPNTEPLPQSTAQPMRRDELAYQRQMAIQSAQSTSTRTFGGQLTASDAYAAWPSGRSKATVTAPRDHTTPINALPTTDRLNVGSTSTPTPASLVPIPALTPQEQARQMQHSAVMNRASAMLKHDQAKITQFRNNVSSYRTSNITASQLIDAFFAFFDAPSADLGTLIKELADIYEIEAKRNDLLKAWNDWRAINEDYPSLPGSTPAAAGSGGRRVLKLKSSTAQSSRSAVSKQGSWNTTAGANPFSAIPAASANRAGAGAIGPVPWTSSASSRPSPASSRPVSRQNAGRTNGVGADAFPALPAAAKPNTMIAGLTRGTVRWDEGRSGNPLNPWGAANGGSGSTTPANELESEVYGEGEQSKKKGKNKKQILYKLG